MNVDIADNAAIADTKLATISAPGKVADSALGANISKLGQAIESSEIANGTITSADLADNAISAAQLATSAVYNLAVSNIGRRLRTCAETRVG